AHNNVGAFGTQLFTTFVFPFEITPLLLLVAMIGAVALGRRRFSASNIPETTAQQETIEGSEQELHEVEKIEV
ncbi:MAG TPA: NADH-quinone oxidoreductase subunit J, partial [Chloroflexota bacterium]